MLDSLAVPARDKDSRYVMVVLHGLGDSLAGYRWLPEALALPWLEYRLVNAPDHYFGGYSWYDYAGNPGPGIQRSREALSALLDGLEKEGYPADKTFLLGFSQGCLMTLEVGLRLNRILAGLVGISGYVHDLPNLLAGMSPSAKQQRVLVTHGTWDSMIPIEPVRGQMEALRRAGVQVERHEFAKDHTIAGEEEVAVIRDFVTRGRISA